MEITPEIVMATTADINQSLADGYKKGTIDPNLISDTYHTFGELYDHRIALWIALCKTHDNYSMELGCGGSAWRSTAHSDGSVWEGWFILGIYDRPGQQITYHLPMSDWDECEFALTLNKAPDWDGHTSADVLTRLSAL